MENELVERMVRIGSVTAVNSGKRQARLRFQDTGVTSGWLGVLAASELWLPKVNETVLALYLPVFNGDGFILGRL